MSTATQQALIIPSPQAPFVVGPRPITVPGKGEVRLKLLSAGLNPMNIVQHQTNFFIPEYPAIIGVDLAGVIDEVGEGVVGFAKGDEVFAQAMNGGFQQYTTVPSATLIRKPKNISFDDAASFQELPKMVEKGVIVPNRIEVLPNGLAGIPDALERMKAGVRGVKLVAHPQESAA
ncbi:GroES-like protein [Mycena sanguinolenta]|uniref:GroES-like protein n=1 Tax=Mycena sanguinolenta TaxID=230812 RepID=A0A8H6XNT8_9AGAR|nr:GroES-like protein [Mycena sanguinolenta]